MVSVLLDILLHSYMLRIFYQKLRLIFWKIAVIGLTEIRLGDLVSEVIIRFSLMFTLKPRFFSGFTLL